MILSCNSRNGESRFKVMTSLMHSPRTALPRRLSALILAALLLLAGHAALASTIMGRVVGIADGDTVTVLDSEKTQHKIRLGGINAPERRMAFGQRVKVHLSDLVFGKHVKVQTGKKDRYGRSVGIIFVDGLPRQQSSRVSLTGSRLIDLQGA